MRRGRTFAVGKRNGSTRGHLLLWITAVLACGAAFVVHLVLRMETIRLGYELGQARRTQKELTEKVRLLSIEGATLREPGRLEDLAERELGMVKLSEGCRVELGRGGRRPVRSGRVR